MLNFLSLNKNGQVSFEFILVLGAVLLLCTVIMTDVFEESSDTLILTSVKDVTLQRISNLVLNSSCFDTYLKSMSFDGNKIILDIEGCEVDLSAVADTIEKEFCGIEVPNNDQIIRCGDRTYELISA